MDTRKTKKGAPETSHPPPAKRKQPRRRRNQGGSVKDRARADRRLVERCLAGEERAWEQLYNQCHPALMDAVKFLLGPAGEDVHLIEEITARIWYALLRDGGQLLARYDPEWDSRLEAFLMGLARIEILRYHRAERRRRAKEFIGGRKMLAEGRVPDWQVTAMVEEFASTLTPQEREFMNDFILDVPPAKDDASTLGLSTCNIWQRRHRIRLKLRAFLDDR